MSRIHSFSQSLSKYFKIMGYMPVIVLGFRDYKEYLQSYLEGEGKPVSRQFPWSKLIGLTRKHMILCTLSPNSVHQGSLLGRGGPICSHLAKLPSVSNPCEKQFREMWTPNAPLFVPRKRCSDVDRWFLGAPSALEMFVHMAHSCWVLIMYWDLCRQPGIQHWVYKNWVKHGSLLLWNS